NRVRARAPRCSRRTSSTSNAATAMGSASTNQVAYVERRSGPMASWVVGSSAGALDRRTSGVARTRRGIVDMRADARVPFLQPLACPPLAHQEQPLALRGPARPRRRAFLRASRAGRHHRDTAPPRGAARRVRPYAPTYTGTELRESFARRVAP